MSAVLTRAGCYQNAIHSLNQDVIFSHQTQIRSVSFIIAVC